MLGCAVQEHTTAAVEVSSLCAQKSPGASQQQGRQCLRPSPLAFKQQCSACGPCNRHRACANQTLQSPAQFGHLNGPPQISDMRQRAKSVARKCLAGRTVLSLLRGAFISCFSCSARHNYHSIEGPRTVDPWKGEQRNNREAGPILACVGAPRPVQERRVGSRSYHGRKVSGYRQSSVVCRSSASGPIINSAIWGSSHSQTGFAYHMFVQNHVILLLSRAASRFVPWGLVPCACFNVSTYFQGCSLLNLGTLRTLCRHTVQ